MIRLLFGLLLIGASSCSSRQESPQSTYRPYADWFTADDDPRLKNIRDKFQSIEKPRLTAEVRWESGWFLMPGSNEEQLQVEYKLVTGNPVDLPHRILLPDQSLWYQRNISVQSKGIMAISADDGAQLFINGRQVNRIHDHFFFIDTVGTVSITIRVLNNAMHGGLRSVSYSSVEKFEQFNSALMTYRRLKRLAEQAVLMHDASAEMLRAVENALDEPNDSNLNAAEVLFGEYPYLAGPLLQQHGDSLIITTVTDYSGPVTLLLGKSEKNLESFQSVKGPVVVFKILKADHIDFYYRLAAGNTRTQAYQLPGNAEDKFSFTVWADSQSGWPVFSRHITNTLHYADAFGIGVGDLVGNGSDEEEWRMLINTLGEAGAARPQYLVAGNHDYDGYYDDLEPRNYGRHIRNGKTWFSFTYGNCAFIALDPNNRFPIGMPQGSDQYKWFHEQLTQPYWQQATWRFVLLHQPPYSQGWPGYHGDQVIRDLLEPVIEEAKIDFVISGHTHDYERLTRTYGKQQTTFLIVGGGGGSLEPMESSDQPKMDTVIKVYHTGRCSINGRKLQFEIKNDHAEVLDIYRQQK